MAFAYLVPLAGGDPIPIVKESVLVGRRPECDIRLEAANVSGKHAELRLHRGHWHVIDLNSSNGTKVNGDKVKKKRLAPGDEVVFARTNKFKLEFDPDAAALAARPKVDAAARDLAQEDGDEWDRAAFRGKEASKQERRDKFSKHPGPTVPAAVDSEDLDWLDVEEEEEEEEEEEKEHDFKKSLLEKAGLEKGAKEPIDEEIDDDLDALEELEDMMDEPPTKPQKLDH